MPCADADAAPCGAPSVPTRYAPTDGMTGDWSCNTSRTYPSARAGAPPLHQWSGPCVQVSQLSSRLLLHLAVAMSAGAGAQMVNKNAEVIGKGQAHIMNINAARGLQDVLKSNLGPKGTLKVPVAARTRCVAALSMARVLHGVDTPRLCRVARVLALRW